MTEHNEEALRAFEADYLALCRKHGLMIVHDGCYVSAEVDTFDTEAIEGLRLRFPYG